MIVSCPACQTRYSYPDSLSAGGMARCGKCDQVVPLVAARPTYVLTARLAAASVRVPVGVGPALGMGDPLPLPQPQASGLDLDTGADAGATPYGVMVADEPTEFVPPIPRADSPRPASAPAAESGAGKSRAPSASAPATAAGKAAAAPGAAKAKKVHRSASRSRWVVSLLALVLLGGGGGAAGYYATEYGLLRPLPIHPSIDPINPAFVGGILGVMLAWIVVRWAGRRR